jgi:hypothetical protein
VATGLPPGWFCSARGLVSEVALNGNPVARGLNFISPVRTTLAPMTGNPVATQLPDRPGDVETEHSPGATGNQVASPVAVKRPALHVAA